MQATEPDRALANRMTKAEALHTASTNNDTDPLWGYFAQPLDWTNPDSSWIILVRDEDGLALGYL